MKQVVTMNNRKIELDSETVSNKSLLAALTEIYKNNKRYRVWYGDIKTGLSWNEENDVMGKISSSTGNIACLILVHNERSLGGGALLDSAIIRIDDIKAKRAIYKHDKFHVKINENEVINMFNGNLVKAQHYIDFLKGNRYTK